MKKIAAVFILILSVSLAHAQGFANVDALQFKQLIESGNGIVLDVRTPTEYSRGHIPNSTLISIADRDFLKKIALLQKDKPIYIYCLTGSRSRAAANYMSNNGYTKVYNLQRGILDWQRNNFAMVKSENTTASNAKVYTPADFKSLIASNQMVFIDFNAAWCAPCKTMSPVIDKLSANYKEKVKVEKIDMEVNRELAQSLKVETIPGYVLIKKGQVVWLGQGVMSYDDLTQLLEKNM